MTSRGGSWTYELDKRKNQSLKSTLIVNVLKDIHSGLGLDRPLVCYLPIAFHPTPNVNNNIGLMWLTFDPTCDTVQTVEKRMRDNMYHVLGSNFALFYNLIGHGKGKSTRRDVDVVLTIIFSEEDGDFVRKSWTFPSVSDYPVYVAISPVIDNLHQKVYITIRSGTGIERSIVHCI